MLQKLIKRLSIVFVALVLVNVAISPLVVANANENSINLSISSEPPTIDPALGTDTTSGAVIDNVFEGLTAVTPDGEIVPAAAESWDVSEDGLTYTFHLRENGKWSNGDPVVAGDFEYGWKRVLNPETISERAEFLYSIEGAEAYNQSEGAVEDVKITAVDDYTLEVVLRAPTSYFDEFVAMYTFSPVNPAVVDSNSSWAVDVSEDYVTNGPFVLSEWNHNSNYVLKKNEHYWDIDNVALDSVNVQIIESEATATSEFMAGSLDFLGSPYGTVSLDSIDLFREEGIIQTQATSAIYWYIMNVTDPVMSNPNIRKALALAVDRQNIVDNIAKGGQLPALGYVPPMIPGFEEDRGYFEDADYDTAREYLAVGLEELGMEDPSELTINLSINTSEAHSVIAQDVQEKWARELGINIAIDNTEWQVYLDKLSMLDYQVGRMGWTGKYNDATTYLDMYRTKDVGNNDTGWESEEYKALLDESDFELDEEARYQLLRDAEAVMIDEMPVIPIYYYSNAFVESDRIQGMDYDAVGRIDLKYVTVDGE